MSIIPQDPKKDVTMGVKGTEWSFQRVNCISALWEIMENDDQATMPIWMKIAMSLATGIKTSKLDEWYYNGKKNHRKKNYDTFVEASWEDF